MCALFSPRISERSLAILCRRVALSLASGIEVRRVWEREATDTHMPLLRARLREISDAVAQGDSVAEGLERTGSYFPPLMHELVDVGEHTGHLAEVFRHLAEHYEEQLKLRRTFFSGITGPLIELSLALVVIGIMIIVRGFLPAAPDILGLNLRGTTGFVIYCTIVGGAVGGIVFLYQAGRRGLVWTEPLQRFVLQLPGIGKPLQTIALAQMAWTLELTLDAGMNLLKALPLSLRSTRNAYYTQHIDAVKNSIRAGNEIHEALSATGAFPFEFLAAVEVGERSGRLPESMKSLARDYQEQARHSLKFITMIAGRAVWVVVAMMMISAIFRTFSSYTNAIYDAAK